MAKLPIPKFNLRLAKAKSPTLISLVFRYKGKRLVYSTGYSIHPKDWDFKKQRPLALARRTDLFSIQRQLDDLATHCTDIFIEYNYGAIGVEEFKDQLDLRTGKVAEQKDSDEISFFEFMDMELAEMKATNMKYHSFKNFKLHSAFIKEFGYQVFGKDGFNFSDVDWSLRDKLVDWCAERNMQLAYGNKTLKVLRQFMERARRKKLHSNTDYHGVGWTISPKKATGQIVTLSPEELQFLADLELSGHLAKIRDICLIGAGTGQRFSDFSRYTPDNFYITPSGVPILSLISVKTEIPTKVPLNLFPWLIPVLERNNYATPKISMQKFNDGIKELCKYAGISERMLKVNQYMGRKAKVEKEFVEKHDVISSHTCRRSFATNLYRMGYNLSQIMPMTGHATETQLRVYIGIDNEQNAEEIGLQIIKAAQTGNGKAANFLRAVK
ncbi:MAG: tyrosine-type recombinase/integrase [Saprospiraceae bacterium]|nr:tyrosine-type recombinase/integrase [Saprospiraceae bacterium]MCB9322973.1 tyrosine-type recombinase/integrase [Lewinellaceae bacterium]